MSESEEFSTWSEESGAGTGSLFDAIAFPQAKHPDSPHPEKIHLRGFIPQNYSLDPENCLPADAESLKSPNHTLDAILEQVAKVVETELSQIEKAQKKIDCWKEKIEKNKALQESNLEKINQTSIDICNNKANRDYWWGRAEQVALDYQYALASGHENDWAWLTKKYGLKNPDGTEMDSKHPAIEELAGGGTSNLSGFYHTAGNRHEEQKKDREEANIRLIRENGLLFTDSEMLRGYISNVYSREIEPLQDGLLLMRELRVKLKALNQEGVESTYGDLRIWSEAFLNDFLRSYPKVPGRIVTEFRKLTSVPLPVDHW